MLILCDKNFINSKIQTAPTSFISCINSKLFWLLVKSEPGKITNTESLSCLNWYQSYYSLSEVSIRSNLASANIVKATLRKLVKSTKTVQAKNTPSSELHWTQGSEVWSKFDLQTTEKMFTTLKSGGVVCFFKNSLVRDLQAKLHWQRKILYWENMMFRRRTIKHYNCWYYVFFADYRSSRAKSYHPELFAFHVIMP